MRFPAQFTHMKKALIISVSVNLLLVTSWAVKRIYYSIPQTSATDYASIINAEKSSLYKDLPVDSDDIIFAGNSITERFPIAEMFCSLNIKNRGIGSNLTSHLLKRIGTIAKGHPKKIFIEIGINDLAQKIPQKDILNNFRAIIDTVKIYSPATLIYVQSLMPTTGPDKYLMPDIVKLNEALKIMCEEKHINLVDMFTPFEAGGQMNESLTTDGTHLNYAGYVKYKRVLDEHV